MIKCVLLIWVCKKKETINLNESETHFLYLIANFRKELVREMKREVAETFKGQLLFY